MKISLLSFLFIAFIFCTSVSAQNGWMKYRMYDGKFSFSLPCLPKIETKEVKNEGMSAKLKTYSCTSHNVQYTAAFTDFPTGLNPKIVLDHARDDFAKGFEGKIMKEKMISVFSHQGRDIWVRAVRKDREDVAVYRFVVVRDRLYALGVTKRTDTPAALQDEKFFSTFTLEG
jgi:hypothetical protein